jgi:hypothetical protein
MKMDIAGQNGKRKPRKTMWFNGVGGHPWTSLDIKVVPKRRLELPLGNPN